MTVRPEKTMTPVTLHFDLVSPYAWLALHAVNAIRQDTGREVIVTSVGERLDGPSRRVPESPRS
ncbi:MAG TPA: hypothetical protein VFV18_02140 [Porticoccaceae bacterium]|nr:hypothetical protein [Porticoccaceae bacterium]